MAVTDLHSLDVSEPLDKLFSTGSSDAKGAVLSLLTETPNINVGNNTPLVMQGRSKGAIRHEGGAYQDTGRSVTPLPFTTLDLAYSQRVTVEFLEWSEQKQSDFVARLIDNWLRKSVPRDIDSIVLHGINPASGAVDTNLSNYVRKTGSSILVPKTTTGSPAATTGSTLDADLATAVEALSEYDINGIALSANASKGLATIVEANTKKYPELGAFGLAGNTFAGKPGVSTPEVGQAGGTEMILGDWSSLLLGFAGEGSWQTLTSGNPDNMFNAQDRPVDLAGSDMVCIRMKIPFGFQVLDPNALAVVATAV